ncbi:adenosine deaminase [Pistricoccus aurantiacus]|uniref:Adenine deaminase n=1 Tax=Pistricoccus aurantiacus TaxID=1883414 RepID=A0A5B8STZ2_9GAMM|nr:adenosine deaminase [Pistricoccus aurantiacus]QEA39774.1 adenosine deaminase [Pistricoccus aurantiacus]
MREFLKRLPKAELHLHIEGTLEPELMFRLAERNAIQLPYASVDEARAAYQFEDLQSFLDVYYQGMNVLRGEEEFFDLALDYLERAHRDGVVHVELSFDPQAHLTRGVGLDLQIDGLTRAMSEAERNWGISSRLIMSFLRDRSPQEALQTLKMATPFLDRLAAVGLDSAERDNPPGRFAEVFAQARQLGLARIAHAGEEGPADYIREALDRLQVCRIDHGVRCLEDSALVKELRQRRIPLTVCPLSNVHLKVVDDMQEHPLPQLLEAGLTLTLNSDDPAYFGGGVLENYLACHEAFGWDENIFIDLAENAIQSAFLDEKRRRVLLERLNECAKGAATP